MSKENENLTKTIEDNRVVISASDDSEDLGILQEIGNIGAGNAATSLSTVLQQNVSIDIPRVCSIPVHLVGKYYNRAEMATTAVLMQLQRDYECDILLMFEVHEAKKIAALMTMAPSVEELDAAMEESAIQELANIVIGSFLTAISDFTGVQLIPTPPLRIVDTFDAILDNIVVKQSMISDNALVFDACFKRADNDAKSLLIIFPSPELKQILIQKSKEMMGIVVESPKAETNADGVQIGIVPTESIQEKIP